MSTESPSASENAHCKSNVNAQCITFKRNQRSNNGTTDGSRVISQDVRHRVVNRDEKSEQSQSTLAHVDRSCSRTSHVAIEGLLAQSLLMPSLSVKVDVVPTLVVHPIDQTTPKTCGFRKLQSCERLHLRNTKDLIPWMSAWDREGHDTDSNPLRMQKIPKGGLEYSVSGWGVEANQMWL